MNIWHIYREWGQWDRLLVLIHQILIKILKKNGHFWPEYRTYFFMFFVLFLVTETRIQHFFSCGILVKIRKLAYKLKFWHCALFKIFECREHLTSHFENDPLSQIQKFADTQLQKNFFFSKNLKNGQKTFFDYFW